jgi:hypothetical protein
MLALIRLFLWIGALIEAAISRRNAEFKEVMNRHSRLRPYLPPSPPEQFTVTWTVPRWERAGIGLLLTPLWLLTLGSVIMLLKTFGEGIYWEGLALALRQNDPEWTAGLQRWGIITLMSLGISGGLSLVFYALLLKFYGPPKRKSKPVDRQAMIYTILISSETVWNSEHTLRFVQQLSLSMPHLIFRIFANRDGIFWQLIDTVLCAPPSAVEQTIRANYPTADIRSHPFETTSFSQPFYRYVAYYEQANFFVAPLQDVHSGNKFDPLVALSNMLNELQPGEQICYTLGLGGKALEAYAEGRKLITQSTIHPLQFFQRGGTSDALSKYITRQDRQRKFVAHDQQVFEDKLAQILYYAVLLVQIDTLDLQRLFAVTAALDAQIVHFTRMPYNILQWVNRPFEGYADWVETQAEAHRTSALNLYLHWLNGGEIDRPPTLILDQRELALLWHLPHQGCTAPRIVWANKLQEASEAVARNQEGIVLGKTKTRGQEQWVYLPTTDRVTHLNIVGKTGTGKSNFMHHLIHQDIAAYRGVAVIDPHGKLISDILRSSIPPEREHDVVILDLANPLHPPPLNPLIGGTDYSGTLKIVSIIDRMFQGTEDSPRMATYLRAALVPLQSETQATMRDVVRMFMDPVYREARLQAVDDPETTDFWDFQYNPAGEGFKRQITDPILVRVRPFYANPTLYPILCHPDSLDFRTLIRQNKIILISLALAEELVPKQERDLVGALLISRLQMAAMKERIETRVPYFVYVDEVQRFVTTSLSDVLSEARKFGLSLVTANQFLGQLTGATLEAVMGNVGTTLVFGCSPEDAKTLALYMKPQFNAHDLTDLDRFHAAVKMQVRGQTQRAFSLLTLPPLPVPADSVQREQRIRQLSVARYTPKSRAEVLAWLEARYPRRRDTRQVQTNSDESSFYDTKIH